MSSAAETPNVTASTSTPPQSLPRRPLIAPAGNAPISEDPGYIPPEDLRSGNLKRDVLEATKRIKPIEDLKNIGNVPCARESLLTGIATGAGFGAISFLSRRRPRAAANWAVGSFIGVSLLVWQNCRSKRAKELAQMSMIQEKYAHRHVSRLKAAQGSGVPTGQGTGSAGGAAGTQSAPPSPQTIGGSEFGRV